MHAFWLSSGVVALAEIGDKTQLLALVLAARFQKPLPVIAGIFCATIANHAAAALVGVWLTQIFVGQTFKIMLALSFIAMGLWTLKPDTLDETKDVVGSRWGVFLTTLVSFFLVEIGDKTQIATVGLAAQFQSILWVSVGTTAGMMLANVPAVLLGSFSAHRIPVGLIRSLAAVLFIIFGLLILCEGLGWSLSAGVARFIG